jgi:hypothetical protein
MRASPSPTLSLCACVLLLTVVGAFPSQRHSAAFVPGAQIGGRPRPLQRDSVGLRRRGVYAPTPSVSLRAQNEEREILRLYILRNSTAAHGIVEWAPSAAPTPTQQVRLRSFEAVACRGRHDGRSLSNAQCTIAEVPFAGEGLDVAMASRAALC